MRRLKDGTEDDDALLGIVDEGGSGQVTRHPISVGVGGSWDKGT